MSISRKLTLSLTAIVALVLALSYSSLHSVAALGGMFDTAANVAARKMDLAAQLRAGFQEMLDHAKKTQLAHAIHNLEQPGTAGKAGGSCSACHAVSAPETDRREFEASAAQLEQRVAEVRPLIADAKGRAALNLVQGGVRNWVTLYRDYMQKADARFDEAHAIITDQMLPVLAEIDQATTLLGDQQKAFFAESNDEARKTAGRQRLTAFALIGLGAVLMAGVVFVLRGACHRLMGMARELGEQASQVAGAAKLVSTSSQALAEGATEQAASLEQVSSSTREINSTAQQNAGNATKSSEVSSEVSRSLGDANRRLEELMTAMQEIEASSGKVAKILKVIDGIAFQTNILALNAAVEAARAGEAGLGFAVVADEVRSLAQRSAQAARETAEFIDASISASQNGMARLSGVTAAFRSLGSGADTVTHLAGEVRSGSLDQARRVEDIAQSIQQMQDVTGKESGSAQESARTGEELTRQAEGLREIVQRLAGIVG